MANVCTYKFGLASLAALYFTAPELQASTNSYVPFQITKAVPFRILKNDKEALHFQLGRMPLLTTHKTDLETMATQVQMVTPTNKKVEIQGDGKIEAKDFIQIRDSTEDSQLFAADIKIPAKNFAETGVYTVKVTCVPGKQKMEDGQLYAAEKSYECWSKNIFVYSPQGRELVAKQIEYVKVYAPAVYFADGENYFPTTVSYLLNRGKTDAEAVDKGLAENKFGRHNLMTLNMPESQILKWSAAVPSISNLQIPFRYNDVREGNREDNGLFYFLTGYGQSNAFLNAGYQGSIGDGPGSIVALQGEMSKKDKRQVTVHYSVIPASDTDSKTNYLFINYHFLYAYDTKGGDIPCSTGSNECYQGKTGPAAHTFDRESAVLVLKESGGKYSPDSMIYGAHLPTQVMSFLDRSNSGFVNSTGYFSWKGGAVRVPWSDVEKENNGKTPKVYVAIGSHGVYPKKGKYGVIFDFSKLGLGNRPLLEEEAGTGHFVIPEGGEVVTDANSLLEPTYKLKELGLLSYDPNDPRAALTSFDGWWIRILKDEPDAKMPPFTDREVNPVAYMKNAGQATNAIMVGGSSQENFKPAKDNVLPQIKNWPAF